MSPRKNPATEPNALELENVEENIHPKLVDIPVHEATSPGTIQVIDVITYLISALAHDREARQLAMELGCF